MFALCLEEEPRPGAMEGEQLFSIPAKNSKGSYFLIFSLYPNSLSHALQAVPLVGSVLPWTTVT